MMSVIVPPLHLQTEYLHTYHFIPNTLSQIRRQIRPDKDKPNDIILVMSNTLTEMYRPVMPDTFRDKDTIKHLILQTDDSKIRSNVLCTSTTNIQTNIHIVNNIRPSRGLRNKI